MTRGRELLPDRRAAEASEMTWHGQSGREHVGRFIDGRPAELFLNLGPMGSAVNIMAAELGIAASFALQHGADVESLLRALPKDERGRAIGPLGELLERLERNP